MIELICLCFGELNKCLINATKLIKTSSARMRRSGEKDCKVLEAAVKTQTKSVRWKGKDKKHPVGGGCGIDPKGKSTMISNRRR